MGTLLSAAVGAFSTLPPLPRRPGDYTRTRVYRDEAFEVLMLDWAPGSSSSIHDHGGQHCWLAVVAGAVRVEDYRRLDRGETPGRARLAASGSLELSRGELDVRSGAYDVHRVRAVGHAITLHVYAAPLDEFLVYDFGAQRCRVATGTCDRILTPLEFAAAG
jgi:cysteine dioxygenase